MRSNRRSQAKQQILESESTTTKRKRRESEEDDEAINKKKAKRQRASNLNPIKERNAYEEAKLQSEDSEKSPQIQQPIQLLEGHLIRALAESRCDVVKNVKALGEHWESLIMFPLGGQYAKPLEGEKKRPKLTPMARHFITWSIYPQNDENLDTFFKRHLSDEAIGFLDKLQEFADEAYASGNSKESDAFIDLVRYVLENIDTASKDLPPKFIQIMFSAWSKIDNNNYEFAKPKTWADPDRCKQKNIFSLLDELMLKAPFDTRSNLQEEIYKSKPDYQVSKQINGKDVVLLIGQDNQVGHSSVGHKDTIKLLELLRDICKDEGIDGISKYGVLNQGHKCTICRAEVDQTWIPIASTSIGTINVQVPMYKVFWIRDEDHHDATFTYSLDNFSKLLKTLAALYFALDSGFDQIEKENKNDKTKAKDKENKKPEEKERTDNNNEKNKDFTHLYGEKTTLLGYSIRSREKNIYYLHHKQKGHCIAKWCYSEGQESPYEVDVIMKLLPLKTVLQPIEWASVDNNRYHVMIFDRLCHSHSDALRNFVASVRGIVATLRYMHKRGLIHGDVKFNNTMYSSDRGVFLFDFECTHSVSCGDDWYYFGTEGHRAPEQILEQKVTVRSEMYSLGIWLIEWFFQRSLSSILFHSRPKFSIAQNEIQTGKVLLEVFEAYVNSQPYENLWKSHLAFQDELLDEPCLTIEQFDTFKVMIRDLLNEDPEQRPAAYQLLALLKYKPFFGEQKWPSIVIHQTNRTVPKCHKINSSFAKAQKRREKTKKVI